MTVLQNVRLAEKEWARRFSVGERRPGWGWDDRGSGSTGV
jgi:hypothetical protein